MEKLKISTAQFENRSGDKEFNLSRIESLVREASRKGSHAIAFHECSVTGYSFARNLSREEMMDLAEFTQLVREPVLLIRNYGRTENTTRQFSGWNLME